MMVYEVSNQPTRYEMSKTRIIKKTTIPARIKPLDDQGVTCYFDITDDMVKHPPVILPFMLLELADVIFPKFLSRPHVHAPPVHVNVVRVARMLLGCTDETLEQVRHFLINEYDNSTLLDELLKVFTEDESVVTVSEPIDSEVVERVQTTITKIATEQLKALKLKDIEHSWFKQRVSSPIHDNHSYALSERLAYGTNLVRLVNKYRDDVILLPKRNPKTHTHKNELILYSDKDNTTTKTVPIIDMFTVGFYDVEVAKKFWDEFATPYKPNFISLNIINKTSDAITTGLSERPYSVFISTKKRPMFDSIGFITPIHYSLSLKLDVNETTLNESIDAVNTFVSDVYKRIARITDKYDVSEPLICVSASRSYKCFVGGDVVSDNGGLTITDCRVKLNSSFNKVITSDICSTPDTIINSKKRYSINHESKTSSFVVYIIDVYIHIPIPTNVDMKNYGRMLNAMKLTKSFDPDYMTLTLMPYVMNDDTQQTLLKLLDELS